MVWIYLLGLLPSLGGFGWLCNNYRPSYNFTKVQVVYGLYLGLPVKMAKKCPSEQSGAGPKRMRWDKPCFVLFPVPLKGVKITHDRELPASALCFVAAKVWCVLCLWLALVAKHSWKRIVRFGICSRGWMSYLLIIFKLQRKKKIFFTLFPNCWVVTSGFSCWPANIIQIFIQIFIQGLFKAESLNSSLEMCNLQFWNY